MVRTASLILESSNPKKGAIDFARLSNSNVAETFRGTVTYIRTYTRTSSVNSKKGKIPRINRQCENVGSCLSSLWFHHRASRMPSVVRYWSESASFCLLFVLLVLVRYVAHRRFLADYQRLERNRFVSISISCLSLGTETITFFSSLVGGALKKYINGA